jgi:hypothetical protein
MKRSQYILTALACLAFFLLAPGLLIAQAAFTARQLERNSFSGLEGLKNPRVFKTDTEASFRTLRGGDIISPAIGR